MGQVETKVVAAMKSAALDLGSDARERFSARPRAIPSKGGADGTQK
ncbi:MAG: hypothetical protein M3O36_15800 [Myxococcota bacterium]|nr:hypothetical protein [Myxococcota bacterium]